MPQQYDESQIADIKEREAKALAFLKELQLTPACHIQMVNIGDDTFAPKLYPYLNDLKFSSKPSPLQQGDLGEPTTA